MVTRFKITSEYGRPSVLEVHLVQETLEWDQALTGRVILVAGSDGLGLSEVKVALELPGRTKRLGYDPGPYLAIWSEVRLRPGKKAWLDFRVRVPEACANREEAELVLEMFTTPLDAMTFRVPVRVTPPLVLVRVAGLMAKQTGLEVGRIRVVSVDHETSRTQVRLAAPEAGHEGLDAIELMLDRDMQRVQGTARICPRGGALERLRRVLGRTPDDTVLLNLDLEIKRLDESIAALEPRLRPFVGKTRDLPIPAAEPEGKRWAGLPIPAASVAADDANLPRPVKVAPEKSRAAPDVHGGEGDKRED